MRRKSVAPELLVFKSVVVSGHAGDLTVDHYPRCQNCGRPLAAYLTRPWSLRCSRDWCKHENQSPPP